MIILLYNIFLLINMEILYTIYTKNSYFLVIVALGFRVNYALVAFPLDNKPNISFVIKHCRALDLKIL